MTEKEFSRVMLLASLFCGLVVWLMGGSVRFALIAAGAALIVFSVAARVIIEAAIVAPKVHYGVVLRWGQKRTGRIIVDIDGLCWVLPFIDKVEFFSYQQDLKDVNFDFFSHDNLQVIGKTTIQWRPDSKIKTKEGKNRFIENKKETIETGISEAIKSKIGDIVGTMEAEAFIGMKSAVQRYLSCILQLEEPPHMCPCKIDNDYVSNPGEIAAMDERLEFYRKNSEEINKKLREAESSESYSAIEKLYGIDITLVQFSEVSFSKETKAALEKQKQAEATMKGAEALRKTLLETIQQLTATSPQSDPEVILNKALVIVGKATNDVHSVEGLRGIFKSDDGKLILSEFLKGGKK